MHGTAAFEIETGRWHGVSREDCVCKECGSGEVEEVSHWLLRCAAWEELRQPLVQLFSQEVRTSNWKNRKQLLSCPQHAQIIQLKFN